MLLCSALIVGLFILTVAFPPSFDATTRLPGTDSTITLRLTVGHLSFSNEYNRRLIRHKPGEKDVSAKLFFDTGGYSRTRLYQTIPSSFIVRGFFDAEIVDTKIHSIKKISTVDTRNATYIGAFDDAPDHTWAFLPAPRSAEESLILQGG